MAIQELRDLGKEFERRKAAFVAEAQALLGKAFAEYFEKHGDKVAALHWEQYTPYFNDGEPCEFSVYDMEMTMVGDGVDPDDEDFDPRETAEDLSSSDGDPCMVDASAIHAFLEENEEIAQDAYGDHVQVIATAKGVRAVDYDHD